MQPSDYIFGIRAVMEAVNAGRDIDRVYIRKGLSGPLAQELTELLRANRILTRYVPAEKLDKITRKNHQGVILSLIHI